MDINKIQSADILDIIFDGRNKQYGAYDLRKTYNRRLTKALIITAGVAALIFLATVLVGQFQKKTNDALDVLDTQMAEIKKDAPPPPVVPPPPPPKAPPPPEINQVKFTPPKIVKDEEVKPEEKIEEIKDDQQISDQTKKTDNVDAPVAAPVEEKGTGAMEAPPKKEEDEDKIFTKVENEAEFPGGDAAWRRYLEKNLDPNAPVENGAPEGTYKVTVQFIVSKDGSISDVKALTSHGYGMEEEAIKIIKKGPKWTPALQNGRNVNAYRSQPITFVVQEN